MRGPVDFHAHLIDPAVYRETQARSVFAQTTDAARAASVLARMADIGERIAAMDAMGTGTQVLSSSLVHQCTYDAAPDTALRLDAAMNETVARAVAAHPDRFRGLGSVPLQAQELAVRELTRCMRELGLSGVTISTRVRDLEIGDAGLRPFWEAAEALGAVVFIHPAGNPDPRFRKWQLWNSIGQSFEEAMAIASLFYEGILDAYPRLKIVVSHGGGYMPFYLGRIARNYVEKPATRANMSKPPRDYVRMLHYDTCVYDPDTLADLVRIVGAERIVMGSDYPVGEMKPAEFVRDCTALDEAQRQLVLSANAERLLSR
ncbi:amidohydrolase family protein [Pseudorhodoplanes sp.]|uniref:amidohydrolase family protein n=1 Tax=Pseudorhodoplanes sp. TaxID=1934341 RepID=UPI00391DB654